MRCNRKSESIQTSEPITKLEMALNALAVRTGTNVDMLSHPEKKTPETLSSNGRFVGQPSPKCCSIPKLALTTNFVNSSFVPVAAVLCFKS